MNGKDLMVELNNVTISYSVIGSESTSPPLLLIMGYGCTKDMWPTRLIEELGKSRRIVVFDNRGMGFSTADTTEFTMELLASDAIALMDYLEIKRADILGWSLGGIIAMQMAINYPDRVGRVIVNASYCGGEQAVHPDSETYEKLTDISGTIEERAGRMFSMLFPEEWLGENPDPTAYFPPITEPANDDEILRQGNLLKSWPGFCDEISRIKAETLFITGDTDTVIPAGNSTMMAGRIDGAKVEIIEGGGHGVMYQFPEKFTGICSDFLK